MTGDVPGGVPGGVIVGVIVAGGLARRLGGGDKGLRTVGGAPVLGRIIGRLRPQVAALALNANGDPARFAGLGLDVVPDAVPDGVPDAPGPLAGILAGLDWARGQGAEWLVTAPGDTPFLPPDLAARLLAGRGGAMFACAGSAGRAHPVAALWPVSAHDELRAALLAGHRAIHRFTQGRVAQVEWDAHPVDPFFNVNTTEDLAEAERLAVLE